MLKKGLIACIVISVLLIITGCQQQAPFQDKGDFKVVYEWAEHPVAIKLEDIFKRTKFFESLADALNENLILPQDVPIILTECGIPNAFYNREKKTITMCYELMGVLMQSFVPVAKTEKELGEGVLYTTGYVFLHELGHALIDIYKLPVTGREEDVADQIATFIFAEGGASGESIILNAALWFLQISKNKELSESAFADEHSLDVQRFFNLACWVFGKSPSRNVHLVARGIIPEARARKCESEYQQLSTSLDKLLSPYIKKAT